MCHSTFRALCPLPAAKTSASCMTAHAVVQPEEGTTNRGSIKLGRVESDGA